MSLIAWNESLSVGVREIDEQHRKLFDLINVVLDSLEQKATVATIESQWKELVDFTKTHFSCEEEIMEKTKCSACDANKKAHHRFLDEITNLHAEFKANGATPDFGRKFHQFVASWLRMHIMVIDVTLKEVAT